MLSSILLSACAGARSTAPPPIGSAPGELRTDASKIDAATAVRMAVRFEKAGDYASALNMYRRGAQLSPQNTVALMGMARIYQRAGAVEEATRMFRRVLELEPVNAEAATGIAENHIYSGEAGQAIRFINQYMIRAPGTPALFNALGIAHDLEGAQDDAQLAYGEGLDLAADDPAIVSNLALSFAVRGEQQTAIALMERILRNPGQGDAEGQSIARQNLALIYALAGQADTAAEIARTVLSAEEVRINRTFYQRLPSLTPRQKARAVFLGRLPSVAETRATEAEASDNPAAEDPPKRPEDSTPVVPAPAQEFPGVGGSAGASFDAYPPYWVQLGSYRSPGRARRGWKTLTTRFPDLLAGYEGYLRIFESEERGQFFRLMVQASETRSAANLVCQTFKIRGLDCLVIRTSGNIRPLFDEPAEDPAG